MSAGQVPPSNPTAPPGFEHRRAGVLLHPTSLPLPNIGQGAEHLLAWLADAGFSVWQMLPTGPTHADGSPYQALSAHAGNPSLIDLDRAATESWLRGAELGAAPDRAAALALAAEHWRAALLHEPALAADYRHFCQQSAAWLDDFALFTALREAHHGISWLDWPEPLRRREPAAMDDASARHRERIDGVRFEQFLFDRQWRQLRRRARQLGIALFGDMPIFVHLDSADVWSRQHLFHLGADGSPRVVAGVPPDYFSATGQRWGNPLYRWDAMAADDYRWWVERVGTQLRQFDLIRVDHFRGFEAFWEIDAASPTAVEGRWVQGPGMALFKALTKAGGQSPPLVAENLGIITPEVEALRAATGLPGMLVLQFAFDGGADNPYLPHQHRPLEVVYTGTHDNDTTAGWYAGLDETTRRTVDEYLGHPAEAMPWPLIRAALASVARLAVIPMQDLLGLDSAHRMNVPGTADGNWSWRFSWEQLPERLHARLRELLALYGRVPPATGAPE